MKTYRCFYYDENGEMQLKRIREDKPLPDHIVLLTDMNGEPIIDNRFYKED